jgi:hypothetical protein
MNEKLPYEHRLADKLNELPVPDEDSSWNRMKTLLDRELPPTGGGGDDGRMPGGRWWGIGVSIGVILLAGWLAYHQGWLGNGNIGAAVTESKETTPNENHKIDSVTGYDRAGGRERKPGPSQKNATDQSNQTQNEKNLLESNQNESKESASKNPNEKTDGAEAASNPANELLNPSKAGSGKSNLANSNHGTGKSGAGNSSVKKSKEASTIAGGLALSSAGKKNSVNGSARRGKWGNNNNAAGQVHKQYSGANNSAESKTGRNNKGSNSKTKHTKPGLQTISEVKSDDDVLKGLPYEESFGLLASHQSNRKQIRVRAESIAEMPEDHPENEKQKKEKSNEGMGLVFGLAFYQNFAISSNLSFNYNSDAKKSIMLDYLPSIYGQYHINNKMYVQAELQFNMPQATPKLLMYSGHWEQMVSGTNYDVFRDIYLQKLYYFNIPMSFHYSPAKNFWLGGGLQFSSLNSGLVSVEDHYAPSTTGGAAYTKSFVSKIKKDTLTDKLSKTEFRLMLDVNYNWRWLTAGLRLNQALKDYINLKYYSAPPAQDKNESLQLYLRFNLWDGRHRMKAATTTSQKNP